MKIHYVERYLDKVIDHSRLTKTEIFSKTKQMHIVQARRILYHLCIQKGITINELMQYLKQLGFDVAYNNIRSGLETVDKQILNDPDLAEIIYNLQ